MAALRRMKGQRGPLSVGDLFVLQVDTDGSFRPGWIVRTGQTTRTARFPGDALVYVYNLRLETATVDPAQLSPDRLLLPSLFMTSWMWHHGYFRTVGNAEIEADQLLAQHCFYSALRDGYVDERDQPVQARHEPSGWFSVAVFEALEGRIASALVGDVVGGPRPTKDRG